MTRARTVGFFIAATIAVLAGAIYVRRDALLIRYRLAELRGDPERFLAYLESDDDTRSAAALRFLDDRAGKEQLFARYLEQYEDSDYLWHVFRNLEQANSPIAFGCLGLGASASLSRWVWPKSAGIHQGSFPIPPRNPERRARILGLLDRIAGETFRSERFPRFEFQIVRVARGERVAARWPEDPPSRYPEQTPFEWRETTDIRHAMMIRAVR
jgi:hypothetical protein